MIRILSSIIVFFTLHSSAFAIEYTFNFEINSSGPIMYACNAGLKHVAPTTAEVCYEVGSEFGPTRPCVKGTHNCECTGTHGGAYLMDYMRYKTGPYDGAVGNAQTKTSGQSGFNQIYNNNLFGNRIDELSFNFGSERYGNEFFVDICYHGPQIDYFLHGVNANFALDNTVTVTDHKANFSYRALAGLKVKSTIVCDTQGHGSLQNRRNSQGALDTMETELDITNTGAAGNGYNNTFAETVMSTNIVRPFQSAWITQATGMTPRFCMIRYTFRETNENYIRKWQEHGAQAVLWQSIEEAIASSNP